MRKERAKHLQRLLHIKEDGIWGRKSQKALDDFARSEGLKVQPFGRISQSVYLALKRGIPNRTIKAEKARAKKHYRTSIIKGLPNALSRREMVAFYGKPDYIEKHLLVNIKPAYPLYYLDSHVKTVRFHERVADNLASVFKLTVESFSADEIRNMGLDRYSGTFMNRPVRGGRRTSTHAYGCAIDMYAEANRLRMRKPEALFSNREYDKWLDIWRSQGFINLGETLGYDWMHFQMANMG